MNEFVSTFSFYGVLRIIIPGLYFFVCVNSLFLDAGVIINLSQNQVLNTIAVSILVIVIGLSIYSVDIPRLIRSLSPTLPTSQIRATYPSVPIDEVEKAYFNFYYSLEASKKEQTERYNGFYHLLINLLASSLILIVIDCIYFMYRKSLPQYQMSYIISILLLSGFSAILIYRKRLIKTYKSDLKLFFDSNQFLSMKQTFNLP
jgi:hypothetical protein